MNLVDSVFPAPLSPLVREGGRREGGREVGGGREGEGGREKRTGRRVEKEGGVGMHSIPVFPVFHYAVSDNRQEYNTLTIFDLRVQYLNNI